MDSPGGDDLVLDNEQLNADAIRVGCNRILLQNRSFEQTREIPRDGC
jgi:hypothetical protein